MKLLLKISCFLIFFTALAIKKSNLEELSEKLADNTAEHEIKKNLKKQYQHSVRLYFDNEDIIDVINYLAAEKGVNVILPAGQHALNFKVTLHLDEKMTISDGWRFLETILDIAGYSLINKGDIYSIVKNSKDIGREPLPIYIAVKPEQLPNTDERIRYVYYLSNIKISDEGSSEVLAILKDLLPENSIYKLDPQTNGIVIADKANNVKAAMQIILAFDQTEIQDKPEVMRLQYVPVEMVANLFNEQILRNTTDPNKLRLLDTRKQSEASFFSRNVRLVPLPRANKLVLLGKPGAVERIKNFIATYIDTEPESGKSVLHRIQLQYLDAEKFLPVIKNIVESRKEGGTEQSKTEGESKTSSVERYFDEVIIVTDRPKTASGDAPEGASLGSNNLIVACKNDDWEIIKKLIIELDVPQPQVIIEVLIVDMSAADVRALGSSLRNPAIISPLNVNFQSAQIADGNVITDSNTNPTTLQSDLLRLAYNSDGTPGGNALSQAAVETPVGASILAASDASTGATWLLMQLLQSFTSTRILSHPHLMSTNNKTSTIFIKEERLLGDEGSGTTGGTTTATTKWIPAELKVEITPRISSLATVNLKVSVTINRFSSAAAANGSSQTADSTQSSGNRANRNVTTNANVRSGTILCLGGLSQLNDDKAVNRTPLLSQIPLIGWLFKYRNDNVNNENLMVFICPTIVEPRFRGGAGHYTRDQVELSKAYIREGRLFDSLQDPITRWFFKVGTQNPMEEMDSFVMRDELISRDIAQQGTASALIVAKNEQPAEQKPIVHVVQRTVTKADELKKLLQSVEMPKT